MVDLGTLANVAEIVGLAAVAGGVIVAVHQIRRYRARRRREEMMTLVRSYRTFRFSQGMRSVMDLPDDLTFVDLQERSPEEQDLVWFVMSTWEALGALVHRREVDIDIVEDLYSGPVVLSWEKLGQVVEEGRQRLDRETYFEWFQWLAERIEERETAEPPEPAHLAHEDWTA